MAAKRQMFSHHHQVATCSQFGRLCPFMVAEVAPGDTWSGKVGALLRLSPLKRAILQDIYVDMFVVYVPHRMVVDDWEDFIADGPMTTPNISLPTVAVGNTIEFESLFMRGTDSTPATWGAMRVRAYNLAWNDLFRDAQDPIVAPDTPPGQWGREVNYKKDYWTTLQDSIGQTQDNVYFPTNLQGGDSASARDVLEAVARQKVQIKRRTYGSRYIDILRGYGVNVNYQMLQRPEVVAISRNTINITDVVSTADGDDLGKLAGHGISGSRLTVKRKSFPEHGTLLGLCVVRPPFTDSRAVDWFDRPREYEHFYDPGLVSLPPARVQGRDISPSMDASGRQATIGHMPWYDWYRSTPSREHTLLGNEWTGSVNLPTGSITPEDMRNITPNGFNFMFNDVSFGHYQLSTVNHLRALRKVPKRTIATDSGLGVRLG